MEQTNPAKKIRESDSHDNYEPQDEASYYLGENFELGGVEFGPRSTDSESDNVGKGPRGYRRSDDDIFHEVCESLTDNPRLDASDIEVEISDGCVHLRGKVSGRLDKREAERCVEYIKGVKDVMNELHFDY